MIATPSIDTPLGPLDGDEGAAFTLVEILVALAVLALIVVLASQMMSATLATVSRSTYTLDSSEAVRSGTMMLRDELAGVVAVEKPERFLNLKVMETEEEVSLYFTVPRSQTTDLGKMGFVTHVAYVWDKEARIFYRAEYHSSRDAEAVAATARSTDNSNVEANLTRLKAVTPSYQGKHPYEWVESELWVERLKLAKKNPLLTGVQDWRIECFEGSDLDGETPNANSWSRAGSLPVALRFQWTINAQRQKKIGEGAVGRRYVVITPMAAREAEK